MADGAAFGELLVEAVDITLRVDGRSILDRVSLRIDPGRVVTLIGPNGAGKTTAVRIVLGLLAPTTGRVRRRPGLRIGYVPQRLQIDPTLPITVRGFLDLGLPRGADRRRERCRRVLDEVGARGVMDSSLHEISGGELQRAMLARALLRDPELLVLDEPAQGVDIGGQADIFHLIGRVREERGCGILLVSHDLHLVMAATDHVICLNQHVCCAGTPESVSQDPAFVALFGSKVASELAVYHHHHDHAHDASGNVVTLPPGAATETGQGPSATHGHPHPHRHGAGHG
jgi:zinc transport system ATP-binding protein